MSRKNCKYPLTKNDNHYATLGVIAGEIIIGLSREQTVSEFAQVLRNHLIPGRIFAPRVSWNPHWLVPCFHVDSQTDKC